MQQTVTAKLQIIVDSSNRQLLCDTMKAYSAACNYVSEYVCKTHDLRRYRVQENTYYPLREEYGLRSQMAVSCVRTVIAKYKTILENQKEWIKPVFRHPQIDLVWNRDYSLDSRNSMFSINTLRGRIRVPFYKNGFEAYFKGECKYGTAKLVNKHGRFFLHMPVTYEIPEVQESDISNITGIDRGIRFLAVAYDSKGKTVFYEGNTVKQKRARCMNRRKQLQQVGTPSSRKRLKAIGQRENPLDE